MADDDKSPEQLQQEMFDLAQVTPPAEPPAEPEPAPPPAPEPPPPAAVEPPEPGVPTWRLREEAEGRRAAEDRARALESRLNEIATHLRQAEKKPDFFENPDKATEEIIQRYLRPVVEQQNATTMYNSKLIAETRHGQDKVAEAEQAFLDARAQQTLDVADYERVVQSPNRYDAVVQWHRKQATLAAVGDDPNAWFEKKLAEKMADPTFQASMLDKVRGSAASRPSETRLPPSLSKTTASAGNTEKMGDMSHDSLFRYAMSNGKER